MLYQVRMPNEDKSISEEEYIVENVIDVHFHKW